MLTSFRLLWLSVASDSPALQLKGLPFSSRIFSLNLSQKAARRRYWRPGIPLLQRDYLNMVLHPSLKSLP